MGWGWSERQGGWRGKVLEMVTGRSMGRRTGGGMPGNEHVLLQ